VIFFLNYFVESKKLSANNFFTGVVFFAENYFLLSAKSSLPPKTITLSEDSVPVVARGV
jgi:hypothetical protein